MPWIFVEMHCLLKLCKISQLYTCGYKQKHHYKWSPLQNGEVKQCGLLRGQKLISPPKDFSSNINHDLNMHFIACEIHFHFLVRKSLNSTITSNTQSQEHNSLAIIWRAKTQRNPSPFQERLGCSMIQMWTPRRMDKGVIEDCYYRQQWLKMWTRWN